PLALRKGCRVGLAIRNEAVAAPAAFESEFVDHDVYRVLQLEAGGRTYEVHSRPGVFAWDRLDGGTRALMETMQTATPDGVLGLGGGSGIGGVGACGQASEGAVTMVDADIVAVESARRTVAANGRTNCQVVLGDGADGLDSDAYDVVAVNP